MEMLSKRAELIRAAIFSHLIGLAVVGFYGTIGTSGGFGNGAWAGMFVGGIISFPWFAVLFAVIWFYPDFYWQNFIALSSIGATLVCGSWWLLVGPDLIDAVALTAIVGSVAFITIMLFVRWRRAVMK